MDDNSINNLKEALKLSPDNIPLKQHLAEILLKANRLEEARIEYSELLKLSPDTKSKIGLAKTFYMKGEYSRCNVILEELIDTGPQDFDTLILHTRALLKEKSISAAVEIYKKALLIDPSYQDKELDRELRLSDTIENSTSDEEIDSHFIQKPSTNFSDVGGMMHVKKEIELKIIKPL
ncbi:MAG: tetratricopeptide repeat protein, partial [Chitinophagales bacterium]|nr:tetratricopeptide repeat protein [Chitinophagales bacterium]